MVYFRCECDFWRLEGVVCRKLDVQKEEPALKRTVGRPHDRGLPVEHYRPTVGDGELKSGDELTIFADGASRALRRWIVGYLIEFFGYALESHARWRWG